MTTERRWYDPPAPRDWHPDPAQLQRLESAASFRKSVLDRSANVDRASLRSSSSGRSEAPGLERGLLERSLRGAASSPAQLPKPAGLSGFPEAVRRVQDTSLPRSVSSPASVSLGDLSATFVLPKPLWRETGEAENSLAGTSSRPRSSSISKYAPLPAISAAKDTNNNRDQEPEFVPPPLVRSRTFDVLDDLPFMEGESSWQEGSKTDRGTRVKSEGGGEDPTFLVTVSIEGKTLANYLSHARDGLLRSRPATRYGRPDPSSMPLFLPGAVAALPASLTPAQWSLANPQQSTIHEDLYGDKPSESEELFKHSEQPNIPLNVPTPENTDKSTLPDPYTQQDDSFNREELETNMGVDKQSEIPSTANVDISSVIDRLRDSSTQGDNSQDEHDSEMKRDMANIEESLEVEPKGVTHEAFGENSGNQEAYDEVTTERRTENATFDYDIEGYDSDDEDEDDDDDNGNDNTPPKTPPPPTENEGIPRIRENEYVGGDTENDINVYFKLPDDSLLMASSPPESTLGRLLGVVGRTKVGGKRLELINQSLDEGELEKSLTELGITNNTVIYLLRDR